MKIHYNACKNTSCKIIHATHAKLGATKAKQSRWQLRNKTKSFYGQLLYLVTEKQRKINFRVAPQQNIKK
jgi:hypothetical protein